MEKVGYSDEQCLRVHIIPNGSCGVCDTLVVTRLRLVTPRVYPIHHSFLGVYLSHISMHKIYSVFSIVIVAKNEATLGNKKSYGSRYALLFAFMG